MKTIIAFAVVIAAAFAEPLTENFVSVTQDGHGNFGIHRQEHNVMDHSVPLLRVAGVSPVMSSEHKIEKLVTIPEEVSLLRTELKTEPIYYYKTIPISYVEKPIYRYVI